MKRIHIFFSLPVIFSFCSVKSSDSEKNKKFLIGAGILASMSGYNWNLPAGFPVPSVPAENPMTDAKVKLGRFLFYEKKLSGNETQSCGSCHLQSIAFADGKPVGVGSTGQSHTRNAQHLSNAAYHTRITWSNNTLKTLEAQARVPMFGISPVELGLSGDAYLTKLKSDSRYKELFAAAFGAGDDAYSEQNVRFSIASFIRSMISGNSAYDKYAYQKKTDALTASQIRGLNIFFGETAECFHCHGGFNFTDTSTHSTASVAEFAYHDNGNRSLTEYNSFPDNKKGLYEITLNTTDIGRFRAPSLRNVALTYPYFHDGSVDCSAGNKGTVGVYSDDCATEALGKIVDHYMSGGKSPSNKDGTLIRPFSLSTQEKTDLINFLKSLTDDDFIKNKNLSDPFK
ncbi:MAG TPA: di-heme enzyme [Leptospiraceae bacterium]|nr:di-heme enzyme [Leptospiraceae bacterium]